MKISLAINGFGRIGRATLRSILLRNDDVHVIAINDLGDIHNLAYLLQYDTAQGAAPFDVSVEVLDEFEQYIVATFPEQALAPMRVRVYHERDPSALPWGELGIDVVIESTGLFTDYHKAYAHILAGAKRVVISAPLQKSEGVEQGETVLMRINEDKFAKSVITSNASCTTNAASPVIAVLDEKIGIVKAMLSTTHAYTASQSIVDGPNKKDWREGRAGAQNIVPSSTGAAKAVAIAIPQLAGKFDGISLRVPVSAGSIADITFLAKRKTTVEEINKILMSASESPRWSGILTVTEDDLVSRDIVGVPFAAIVDSKMTRVVDGDLVKVLVWYDNEIGYTQTLVEHAIKAGSYVL